MAAIDEGHDVVGMVHVDEKGNIFYVAKDLADKVLGEGSYKVLEEMKGSALWKPCSKKKSKSSRISI